MVKQYVIIGVSAAGIGCMSKLRQLDPEAAIIALSDEPDFPYNKCFLVDYVSGTKTQEQIYTKAPTFFADNSIDLRLGTKVVAVNAQEKTVTCHDGTVLSYDALLLATGGAARSLHVSGSDNVAGIMPFYTYSQADAVRAWAVRPETETIVVVGAGLSGLECADALLAYNRKIMVIDTADRPLPHHTTPQAGDYLVQALTATGVQFLPKNSVASVSSSNGVLSGVTLSSGESYSAQMLVWAIGAQPNLTLAKQAGLAIAHNAVVANQYMQTSDPSIFTAGDCALVTNVLTQEPVRSTTWPDAIMQGMVVAHGMVGISKTYAGVVPLLSSSFFGKKFYTAGTLKPVPGGRVLESATQQAYIYVVLDNQGVVQGFNLIGDVSGHAVELKRSLVSQTVYQGPLLEHQ